MKIGQGKALKNKWIKKDGAGFIRAVSRLEASGDSSGRERGLLPRSFTSSCLDESKKEEERN
jgi:hypothetical protein